MKHCIEKKDAVYALIQARMNSTRLGGKILKPLLDKPIVQWVIERARKIDPHVTVAVITGKVSANAPLVDWCHRNKVLCFEGSEDDVLSRYRQAAEYFKAKTVIRLTADNPLFDYQNAYHLLVAHLTGHFDYSTSKLESGSNLPDGIGVEIFSADALMCLDSMQLSTSNREHVNDYILSHASEFKTCVQGMLHNYSSYRFTIDTCEDYEQLSLWLKQCEKSEFEGPHCWEQLVKSNNIV